MAQALADSLMLHISEAGTVFDDLERGPAFARRVLAGLRGACTASIATSRPPRCNQAPSAWIRYLLRQVEEGSNHAGTLPGSSCPRRRPFMT